jgi:hypothetical protein
LLLAPAPPALIAFFFDHRRVVDFQSTTFRSLEAALREHQSCTGHLSTLEQFVELQFPALSWPPQRTVLSILSIRVSTGSADSVQMCSMSSVVW